MSHPIISQNVHFDFSCDQHQLTSRILYIDIFFYFSIYYYYYLK